MTLVKSVCGLPILVEINRQNDGWDVGIYVGLSTHINAVSLAYPFEAPQTLLHTTCMDGIISERWASTLSRTLQKPVCVRCAIHSGHTAQMHLPQISVCCDELLQSLIESITSNQS